MKPTDTNSAWAWLVAGWIGVVGSGAMLAQASAGHLPAMAWLACAAAGSWWVAHRSETAHAQALDEMRIALTGLARGEIAKSKYAESNRAGYVLTGGASKLPGIVDLAERVFAAPVRTGNPLPIGGLYDAVNDPIFSTGVGLVLCAAEGGQFAGRDLEEGSLFENIIIRMKNWLKDFF